ncbi:hypothetical protein BJ322DRAFT_857334 [Thelephora terrestris]|uniref:Uncharacterized protein n=1 Tax=Thelephora terrestris TaxID=56493 RepID=A0A9P6L5T1_9AGAM|nr:hypothetical protein BJ322DRAFT_857334 [Thelephora terrestris]
MHSNTVPSNHHHVPNDSDTNTSNPLSGVHRASRVEGSLSEFDASYGGPMDLIPNIHCPSQDLHPSNASTDWDTIAAWTSGATGPLYQETFEGAPVFEPALLISSPYLHTYLNYDSLSSAHESFHLDVGQSTIYYPLAQMASTEMGYSSLGVPEEMEHQSTPEMTYMNRSPSMPLSALDSSALTSWSGPIPLPGDEDHRTLGLASAPKKQASFRGLVMDNLQGRETTLGTWTDDSSPSVVSETDPANVSSLPSPMPINWRKIPQRRYTSRTGDTSFLQSHVVTFSVKGVPGLNMQHALDQVFVGLGGRDEPVLENANGPASCRLLFPGYPINAKSSQIAVKNWKKDPAPIPKSKLSYEVAKRVRQYLDELVAIPIDPSADPQWTIGKGFMKFEKMYLVSVSWASKGSLQPEIWVDAGDV